MKLIHLSDLHLGKRVNEVNMLPDQRYILAEILQIVDGEKPDGVMIAGDVYDKSVPSAEAVQLFDEFLCQLARRAVPVFVISGNHDSPERIAFGGRLMHRSGIYMSPVYDGTVTPVVLHDAWGEVNIYMLPFIKPAHVRRFYPDEEIASYTDAVSAAIAHMAVDPAGRNVLMTHQFVTGALRSQSEEVSVGGTDNVDASVFADFDYVALGHIHGPQSIGRETLRYCGTPLKYSASEARHTKSVTVVELAEKGSVRVRAVPLTPLHDLREIRGSYMELTARSYYQSSKTDDYLYITLTDEEDIPNAMGKLRVIYPNLMALVYDNRRTAAAAHIDGAELTEQKTPMELFMAFYQQQNNQPMSREQADFSAGLIEKIWEGEA
ncbi:MAG: exonuclease SbcCD subunit D [Clostridiales bacterium]|nr:exonuclease SbcCD subunit D [Candidatus Cacconaster stercorequi]